MRWEAEESASLAQHDRGLFDAPQGNCESRIVGRGLHSGPGRVHLVARVHLAPGVV